MDSHGERVRYLENLIREHKILTSSLKSSFPLFPPFFLLFTNYRLNIILIIPVKFFDAQFKLQYSKWVCLKNIIIYDNIILNNQFDQFSATFWAFIDYYILKVHESQLSG